MSIDQDDRDRALEEDVRRLLSRAAAMEGRARRRLSFAIDDFFIPEDGQLDDRLRALLGLTLAALVDLVERDIRGQAARALAGDPAATALTDGAPVLDRLIDAGMLRDVDLLGELIDRLRLDLLADLLPAAVPEEGEGASLMAQLAANGDEAVAAATRALMTAETRRRGFFDTGRYDRTDLPAELHHRLVWCVAAVIREQAGPGAADRAIGEAAARSLAAHDEGDRVESAAIRLASAIDARPAELAMLLIHTLAERRLTLFVALLARALGADFTAVREVVVDDASDRLWLALRAVGLDRAAIARIGVQRGHAGSPAAIEALADQIDAVAAIAPDAARGALTSLNLPADFRAAVLALEERR